MFHVPHSASPVTSTAVPTKVAIKPASHSKLALRVHWNTSKRDTLGLGGADSNKRGAFCTVGKSSSVEELSWKDRKRRKVLNAGSLTRNDPEKGYSECYESDHDFRVITRRVNSSAKTRKDLCISFGMDFGQILSP